MSRSFYYARLNENQICTEVIVRKTRVPEGTSGYVLLPDYNEEVIYKKWQGEKGWSFESFEPTQDQEMLREISELKQTNIQLLQRQVELDMLLASFIGGGI